MTKKSMEEHDLWFQTVHEAQEALEVSVLTESSEGAF